MRVRLFPIPGTESTLADDVRTPIRNDPPTGANRGRNVEQKARQTDSHLKIRSRWPRWTAVFRPREHSLHIPYNPPVAWVYREIYADWVKKTTIGNFSARGRNMGGMSWPTSQQHDQHEWTLPAFSAQLTRPIIRACTVLLGPEVMECKHQFFDICGRRGSWR